MKTYIQPVYPYAKPADLGGSPHHWPVIVAGAGPVGLTAAIDLALRGIDVLVLDEDDTVSVGSRAICCSNRSIIGQRSSICSNTTSNSSWSSAPMNSLARSCAGGTKSWA